MKLLLLAFEFFKVGLFAVGGGMATVPFLMEMTRNFDWFTAQDLSNMIAISESTPGPIGVNMATYAGYTTAGIPGALVATLSLVLPSFLIILIISGFLTKFRSNRYVNSGFYGIRAGVIGMLLYVCISLIRMAAFPDTGVALIPLAIIIIATVLMQLKPLKKLHPVVWIVLGAVLGIVFKL